MASLIILKFKGFFMPFLRMVTLTAVPLIPLNFSKTSLFVIFGPVIFLPSTFMSLSPALIPIFSDGPPSIGFITRIVSFIMLNSTPIPSKFPSKLSFVVSNSAAAI